MMRELFDLGGETVSPEALDGLNDAGMQHASLCLQETAIGHVMGERMLEGVGRLGIQARLVQEFCLLQVRKAPTECVLGQLGYRLQEGEHHLPANDRSALE